MSGHTPGPWSFKPSESDPNLFQVLDAQGCVIGFVLRGDRAATRIVCESNARLISASPELLEASIEMLAAGQFSITSDDYVAAMLRFGAADEALKAAIAKATGAAS